MNQSLPIHHDTMHANNTAMSLNQTERKASDRHPYFLETTAGATLRREDVNREEEE